ncbi:MAG: hypothetical protein J5762_03070, partial [Clostridia bacterium]|nr:hypothetical protein [Clostridia bacterium]
PATCTEGGKSEYVAIYGGNRYSKVFDTPALDHDYQYAGFEWADDNLTAKAVYNCSRCTSQQKYDAGISFQNRTEPTCTEDGVTDVIAVYNDGENHFDMKEGVVLTKLGHNMAHIEYLAPTCTTDGNLEYYYCDRCDKYFADENGTTETTLAAKTIAATGHAWQEEWTWEEDASAATLTLTCENDPEHVAADLEATIGEPDRTEANCYNAGEYIYTATVEYDGKTFTAKKRIVHTAALGHDYEFKGFIWSEDVEDNIPYAVYICKRNGPDHDNSVPEHEGVLYVPMNVNDTENVTPATCTTDGSIKYTTRYTHDDVEIVSEKIFTIPKTGHTMEGPVAAVAATCTTAGNPQYWHCTVCDKYFADENGDIELESVVIPAIGQHEHEYTEFVGFEWADDNLTAKAVYKCTGCEARQKFSASISLYNTTEPTCTQNGVTDVIALYNDGQNRFEMKNGVVLPAFGHDYQFCEFKWSVDGKTAIAVYICANCGDEVEYDADMAEEIALAATCEAKGKHKYTATYGTNTDYRTVEDINALGHDWKFVRFIWAWDYTSATVKLNCERCDTDGECEANVTLFNTTFATCTADGYTDVSAVYDDGETHFDIKYGVVLPALGHDMTYVAANEPSCEENGNYAYWYCDRCEKYFADENGATETTLAAKTIAAIGHAWQFAEFTWAEDNLSAQAHLYCDNCGQDDYQDAVVIVTYGTADTPEATCTTAGLKKVSVFYVMPDQTVKQANKDVVVPTLGHIDENGDFVCDRCGHKCYTRVDENGNESETGGYILFGEYPQTVKANNVTITDTTDSRGYYLGSDGAYYAKLAANPYSSGYTFTTGATINSGTVYYFKVEPIKWRILEISGGKATILCEMLIDVHRFDDDSNNYKNSEIRAWLNDNFYNTAFSSMQKQLINTVTVDNSARSTNPDGSATEFNNGVNQYACENTEDKVWLLSVQEATRDWQYCSFGSYSTWDTLRRKKPTDYAKANYAYTYTSSNYYGCGVWWLRSPSCNYSYIAWGVIRYGYTFDNYGVSSANYGVSPALQITL